MTNFPPININIELSSDEITGDLVENHQKNRNALRVKALKEFFKERAGEGTKDLASNYRYNVEILKNGNKIYVTRPAFLNKGFDFVIHVENMIFANGKDHPRHDDISNDIKGKIDFVDDRLKNLLKNDLYHMIEKVYYCVDTRLIIDNFELSDKSFLSLPGYTLDMLLKVIKWFFIEQDICYWNWSGRSMFMNGVKDILITDGK